MSKKPKPAPASTDTSDPPFAVPVWAALDVEVRKVAALIANPLNARTHPADQIEGLRASIRQFGLAKGSILVDERDMLIAGHGMTLAAQAEGVEEIPVCIARGWSDEKKRAFMEADNRLPELGGWNDEARRRELDALRVAGWDMASIGWDTKALDAFLVPPVQIDPRRLAERFGIVPFSVFNAREGWWQDRKRMWIALGIKSEVGRGENLLEFSDAARLDGAVYKERAAEHRKRTAAPAPG